MQHSIYDNHPPIVTILCDLDILEHHQDINDIIHNPTITTIGKIGPTCALLTLDKLGPISILPTHDKLAIASIINKIITLNSPISHPSPFIINHTIHESYDIITAYCDRYSILINSIQNYDGGDLESAISNGLYVKKLSGDLHDGHLKICNHIEELEILNDDGITSFEPISKTLRKLSLRDIFHHCLTAPGDNPIKSCTNIQELYMDYYNYNITSYESCANTLRVLSIKTEITAGHLMCDNDLRSCVHIEELYVDNNAGITTCEPFSQSLRKISARGALCGMYDAGLQSCASITYLDASGNPNITTCNPFAHTIRILHATWQCGIKNNGISRCITIEELHVDDNLHITTCDPFARTIRILSASNKSGITDDGLKKCRCIESLNASSNKNITTCAPFAKCLKRLSANSSFIALYTSNGVVLSWSICGIDDYGLSECKSLKYLSANENALITTCEPFKDTITQLFASGNCGISDDGIRHCTKLREIISRHNDKISLHNDKITSPHDDKITSPHDDKITSPLNNRIITHYR